MKVMELHPRSCTCHNERPTTSLVRQCPASADPSASRAQTLDRTQNQEAVESFKKTALAALNLSRQHHASGRVDS